MKRALLIVILLVAFEAVFAIPSGSDKFTAGYYPQTDSTEQKYLGAYGVRIPILDKWEMVCDRDFPAGALIYVMDGFSNEAAFISVSTKDELMKEDDLRESFANSPAPESTTIDGHKAMMTEIYSPDKTIKALFIEFSDVLHNGEPVVVFAFASSEFWDKISDNLNQVISKIEVED